MPLADTDINGTRIYVAPSGGYELSPFVVELVTPQLNPGSEAQAKILRWVRKDELFKASNTETGKHEITIHDTFRQNHGIEGEWFVVKYWPGLVRYVIEGSQGLVRKGKVVESTIAPNNTGTVEIWTKGVTTTSRVFDVEHNWMTNSETLAVDQEVLIRWFRDEGPVTADVGYPDDRPGRWVVIDSDCNFA